MLEIGPESKLKLSESTMLRAVSEADQYYAFDIKKGDHFSLNETAYSALEKIGAGIKFKDLVDYFVAAYDLPRETAMKDLMEILKFAIENEIIEEEKL